MRVKASRKGNGGVPDRRSLIVRPVKHGHGMYCNIDIDALDGRTRLSKSYMALKETLRAFVGEATPGSELLIQRIVYKSVKLALYEAEALKEPANVETGHYLPMANSLRLDLQALALMADKTPSKIPTIEELAKAMQGGTDE